MDLLPINDEIVKLSQKSKVYLSLSKNILQMDEVRMKIPKIEHIQNLKKLTRNMKFSILKKKISSFFSSTNNKELEKLKEKYEKNKQYLNEILELQKKYNDLKRKCKKEFDIVYPEGNGQPDEDALKFEFKIYKILEDEYLPTFKEQEISNTKTRLFEINQEVYKIYLESLRTKISLMNVKIKSLNTELYIQINCRENLYKQYSNLLIAEPKYLFSESVMCRDYAIMACAIYNHMGYDCDLIIVPHHVYSEVSTESKTYKVDLAQYKFEEIEE